MNEKAAGIDIGSEYHYASAADKDGKVVVKRFCTFTTGIEKMVEWFKELGVESVAMEATGVYWITAYEMLENAGFEVRSVQKTV